MKLLPLLVFWCLWFVNYSTRSAFSPVLPLIEDNLSLSHGAAGGLFASLSIGNSLALITTGRIASFLGYKRTVTIGFVGIGLVLFVFQWAHSYLALHVLFFLLGLAAGTYIPSILPIITETYDHKDWGKAIGFHDSAASLSIFAIPILVAFGLHFFEWRRLLVILGGASLLLCLSFWTVSRVSSEPRPVATKSETHYGVIFRKKTIWIMGGLWAFATGSCAGVYSILPLYLVKERGIDLYLANTLFGISRAGGVFISILIGFLMDRFGYEKMLRLSLLATGLSTIALALSNTLPLILITLILQATLSLAFFPVGMAILSKLTSPGERSMTIGLTMSFGSVFGMGFTPFLLGVTADHLNFGVGILGLGVLTTLSSIGVSLLRNGGR